MTDKPASHHVRRIQIKASGQTGSTKISRTAPLESAQLENLKQISVSQIKTLEKELLIQINQRLFTKGLITKNMFCQAADEISRVR